VSHTFSARQPLFVFLESYEQTAASMRPLVAYIAFYRENAMRLETPPTGFTSGWNPASRAVPIRFTVSLTSLEPGEYDCQVSVLDPGSGRAAFWRTSVVIVR